MHGTPLICSAIASLTIASIARSASPGATCADGEMLGVRIDYDASIPSAVVAMAPRSEVQARFPDVGGITNRTVFVTADSVVDIQRGQTLKSTVTTNPNVPAPGVHLRDKNGHVIEYVGYAQVPLHTIRIQTKTERVSYSSHTGQARRSVIGERDSDIAQALLEFDEASPAIGERKYAGLTCTAKRIPTQGPRTETCVRNFLGWPVALYLQFDSPDAGLQWYRATRVHENACITRSEIALPAGVKIVDRRKQKSPDSR